jgi:hypothetical protein
MFVLLSSAYAVERKDLPKEIKGRRVFTDTDIELPADYDKSNPYTILAEMINVDPVMDHTGKPHDHGHWIQIIRDGGNFIQDPPNPDGSPGGDDSLAWGNFNMFQLCGHDWNPKGKSGQFASQKYFIPYYPDGLYYLRLWEGDPMKGQYYQDTQRYRSMFGNQGGSMIRIAPATMQGPVDVEWFFGPSVERPKAEKKK